MNAYKSMTVHKYGVVLYTVIQTLFNSLPNSLRVLRSAVAQW